MIYQYGLNGLVFSMPASSSCGRSWVCAPAGSYQIHKNWHRLPPKGKSLVVQPDCVKGQVLRSYLCHNDDKHYR